MCNYNVDQTSNILSKVQLLHFCMVNFHFTLYMMCDFSDNFILSSYPFIINNKLFNTI